MTITHILPPDKAQHALAGAIAYLFGAAVCVLVPGYPPAAGGIGAALGVGIGKEVLDWLSNRRALRDGRLAPHAVDSWDMLATLGGGIAMWCAAVLGAA